MKRIIAMLMAVALGCLAFASCEKKEALEYPERIMEDLYEEWQMDSFELSQREYRYLLALEDNAAPETPYLDCTDWQVVRRYNIEPLMYGAANNDWRYGLYVYLGMYLASDGRGNTRFYNLSPEVNVGYLVYSYEGEAMPETLHKEEMLERRMQLEVDGKAYRVYHQYCFSGDGDSVGAAIVYETDSGVYVSYAATEEEEMQLYTEREFNKLARELLGEAADEEPIWEEW